MPICFTDTGGLFKQAHQDMPGHLAVTVQRWKGILGVGTGVSCFNAPLKFSVIFTEPRCAGVPFHHPVSSWSSAGPYAQAIRRHP